MMEALLMILPFTCAKSEGRKLSGNYSIYPIKYYTVAIIIHNH